MHSLQFYTFTHHGIQWQTFMFLCTALNKCIPFQQSLHSHATYSFLNQETMLTNFHNNSNCFMLFFWSRTNKPQFTSLYINTRGWQKSHDWWGTVSLPVPEISALPVSMLLASLPWVPSVLLVTTPCHRLHPSRVPRHGISIRTSQHKQRSHKKLYGNLIFFRCTSHFTIHCQPRSLSVSCHVWDETDKKKTEYLSQ